MCRGGTGTRQSRAGQNRAEPDRTGQKWAETNRNGQEWDRPGKAWRDATGQKRNRARWGWAGCEWVTEERTGPCRLGWGGACTAGRAPRSPRAIEAQRNLVSLRSHCQPAASSQSAGQRPPSPDRETLSSRRRSVGARAFRGRLEPALLGRERKHTREVGLSLVVG